MAELRDLVGYCDQLLETQRFQDYCPNGLQVQGRDRVERVVSGVTACQALVDAAVDRGADLVLVHHGYFWKGEDARVTGMKARRLSTLLGAGVSLLAYHLPLDAHETLGNNAALARVLGIEPLGRFATGTPVDLGWHGRLARPMAPGQFARHVERVLGREPVHVAAGRERVDTIAWCTGAAQGFIDAAADLGVDAYLSGEISEPTVHVARERGIEYFAAGHHATERYGVQSLGEDLAQRFGIHHEFVDVDSPA